MEIKKQVRPSPGYILQVLGTFFCTMYLLLGTGAVLVFVMINTGLIKGVPHLLSLQHTYLVLAAALTANFIGFLTNILLVVSGINLNVKLIVPWLVFHLIFILFLLLGGLILLLHLLVSLRLYMRSLLCTIPILAGLLLTFVWLKVYLQLFTLRRIKRQRKFQLLKHFYNNQSYQSYVPYNSPKHEDAFALKQEDQIARSRHQYNSHYYPDNQTDIEQTDSRLVTVGSLTKNFRKPNYFFGDAMGFLRRFNRSMETIEASIHFDEEKDQEDHHYENVKGTEEQDVEEIYIISSLGILPKTS